MNTLGGRLNRHRHHLDSWESKNQESYTKTSETLDIVRRLEETVGVLAVRVQELQDANAEKDVLIASMSDRLSLGT